MAKPKFKRSQLKEAMIIHEDWTLNAIGMNIGAGFHTIIAPVAFFRIKRDRIVAFSHSNTPISEISSPQFCHHKPARIQRVAGELLLNFT